MGHCLRHGKLKKVCGYDESNKDQGGIENWKVLTSNLNWSLNYIVGQYTI